MRNLHPRSAVIAALLLTWAGARAMADDRVPITITNNGTDDIIVTVRDMNTSPPTKILSQQRINGFASVPVAVIADAAGNGHVSWRAYTTDPSMRKCGRKNKAGLASGASVHVYAKSQCP